MTTADPAPSLFLLDPTLAQALRTYGDQLYSVCDNVRGFETFLTSNTIVTESELYTGIDRTMLADDNAWYTLRQYAQLMNNVVRCQRRILTHYEYADIGAHSLRTRRSFWYRYLAILPLKALLRESAKIANRVQNAYHLEILKQSGTSLIFIVKDTEAFSQVSFGSECRYLSGIMGALFGLNGISSLSVSHNVCGKSLRHLLARHYGIDPVKIRQSAEGVSLDGELFALPIAQEDLCRLYPELSAIPARGGAFEVIRDVEWKGIQILRKGEIYGAPCCLIHITYEPIQPLERLKRFLFSREKQLEDHVHELGRQIQFAREKLFESQRALYDSKLKSSILRVYVRPSLVERIDKGENPLEFKPAETDFAILFNDIIGFTAMSESMSPSQVVSLLNLHFESATSIIFDHGGEVDKIMGDCVLGLFADADNAIAAAIAIQKAQEANRERAQRDFSVDLRAGTSVHYGRVILGNVGGKRKLDYTIIGDPVNCASRIQDLTRKYGVGLLVSDDLKNALHGPAELTRIGEETLAGRTTPTALWTYTVGR